MNILSLDLEMNKPSEKIIQVGACVINLLTGEIVDKLRLYVRIDEPLHPFIITLTGITEDHLATQGISLPEAYLQLQNMYKKWQCYLNPITWGGGDSECLRTQLNLEQNLNVWCFGRRWLDTKTLFQTYAMANNIKAQAGLAKALTKVALSFKGRKHDALDDAINTAILHHWLFNKLKEKT